MDNEETQELEIAEEENSASDAGLTDDDLAASLGFMTTLTEQSMPRDPMQDMGDDMEETPGAEASEDTTDAEQDRKIQELEAAIARLEATDHVENPTDTGTQA